MSKRGGNKEIWDAFDEEDAFTMSQMKKAAEFRVASPLDPAMKSKTKKAKKLDLKSSKKAIESKLDDV